MTSTRGQWLRFLLAGLSIVAAPAGLPTAWAQGFGPDPFQPYNSQYEPYTRPLGPASPGRDRAAGVNGHFGARATINLPDYLNELAGDDRGGPNAYGIGCRTGGSNVDSRSRQAEASASTGRSQQTGRGTCRNSITQKYLAYFTERDPRRRATLLRDYQLRRTAGRPRLDAAAVRVKTTPAIETPRRGSNRSASACRGPIGESDDRFSAKGSRGRLDESGRPGQRDPSRRVTLGRSAGSRDQRSIPPPPPLPSSVSRATARNRRKPSRRPQTQPRGRRPIQPAAPCQVRRRAIGPAGTRSDRRMSRVIGNDDRNH